MIVAQQAKLQKIEISDFKSFIGRWLITPVIPFTCIVAPNGSGKSNFIDAVVFCLGEDDADALRVNNLSDLVPEHTTQDPDCYVSVTINTESSMTEFKRLLIVNEDDCYESVYAINDQVVSSKDYMYSIQTLGINIEANDFVVRQGEIEHIVRASPLERTRMLEVASGSIRYKENYDKSLKNHTQALEKVKKLTTQRKQLKKEAHRLTEFIKVSRQSELDKEKYAGKLKSWYLLSLKINRLKNEKAIEEEAAATAILNKVKKKKRNTKAIQETSIKIQECEVRLTEAQKELDGLAKSYQETNEKLLKYDAQIEKLKKSIDEQTKCDETIKDIDFRIEENEMMLMKYSKKLQEDYRTVSEHEVEYKSLLDDLYLKRDEILSQTTAQDFHHKIFELDSKKRKLSFLNQQIAEMLATLNKNNSQIESNHLSHAKLIQELNNLKKERRTKAKQLLSAEEIEKLVVEKQKIDEQLLRRRISTENNNRLRKQAKIVADLKSRFPGMVYDRVRNLCTVSDSKYKVVLAAAIDKKLKSIVVQNDETAIGCIKYVEDNKLGFEEFYAIDSVGRHEMDRNSLRSIRAKLVYDVLKFDRQYDSVIKTIVKSTLLCETLEQGFAIVDSLGGRQKHKIVTLSGSIVNTNGVVTTGYNHKQFEAAHIGDSTTIDLEVAKNSINEKLEQAESDAVRKMVAEIDMKIHERLTALKILEASTEYLEQQNVEIKEKLTVAQADQENLQQEILELEAFKKKLDSEFREVSDSIFAEFCEQIGIPSPEHFENLLAERKAVQENIEKCKLHLHELRSLRSYEESRSKSREVKKWRENLRKLSEERETLYRSAQEAEQYLEAAFLNVRSAEETFNQETETFDANQGKGLELAELERKNRKKLAHVKKLFEKLKFERQEIISNARKDGVPLPTSNNLPQSQSSIEDSQKVFDFNGLDENLRTSSDINFLESELEACATTLKEMTGKIREYDGPDVKQDLKRIKDELRKIEDELIQSRKNVKEFGQIFERAKEDRRQCFGDFFMKVESTIDQIYKQITNSEAGYATLICENTEEPYLAEIRYDFTPPGKTYRPGEDRSGGEKSMAALAFLFALQEARTPSFILLDEVDGAFDMQNVDGLIGYLRKVTEKHQLIMISHNSEIHVAADALLCIGPDMTTGYLQSIQMIIDLKSKFAN